MLNKVPTSKSMHQVNGMDIQDFPETHAIQVRGLEEMIKRVVNGDKTSIIPETDVPIWVVDGREDEKDEFEAGYALTHISAIDEVEEGVKSIIDHYVQAKVLWEGAISEVDTVIELISDISEFKYIEFYGRFRGQFSAYSLEKHMLLEGLSGFTVRGTAIPTNEANNPTLRVGEMGLTYIGDRRVRVNRNMTWHWNGSGGVGATLTDNSGDFLITKILGVDF